MNCDGSRTEGLCKFLTDAPWPLVFMTPNNTELQGTSSHVSKTSRSQDVCTSFLLPTNPGNEISSPFRNASMTRTAWCHSFMASFLTQYRQQEKLFKPHLLCCPHFPVPLPKPLKISSRDVMALGQAGYFAARQEKKTQYVLSYL